MPSRRITETCKGYRIKRSYNSTGDEILHTDFCNKPLQLVCEAPQLFEGDSEPSGEVYQVFKCGHSRLIDLNVALEHSARNLLFDRLLPFQQDFVNFAETAGLRVILTDRMGLGKTVQVASLLRENVERFTDNFTKFCVYVAPVGSIYNVKEEFDKWIKWDKYESIEQMTATTQVVVTSKQILTDLAKIVVIPWSKLGDKEIVRQLKAVGIASIIVDECHFYKDERSARTKNLLELVKISNDGSPNGKPPLVLMSGTITENRVMELKVPLNLIDPLRFSSWYALDRMCAHDHNGKALGIASYWREEFFRITSKYMIGRTKEEAKIPLPRLEVSSITVNPREWEVNKEVVDMYNTTLDELAELVNGYQVNAVSIIGLMQQLRHLTGRMKIMAAAVYIDSWMTLNPGQKFAVGIHHKFVREALAKLLSHRNPLQMSDEDPKEKDAIELQFKNSSEHNLLICSILSAGVGRNFQFCKNALILERQWNKSKEDQFIERFHRIIEDADGRVKTHFTESDTVRVTVMNADPSFDEFFDALIHLKGIIVDSTDDSVQNDDLPEDSFVQELAKTVIRRRIKWVGV